MLPLLIKKNYGNEGSERPWKTSDKWILNLSVAAGCNQGEKLGHVAELREDRTSSLEKIKEQGCLLLNECDYIDFF